MPKDESGHFHPGKGKPSGVNKEEGLGLQPTPPEDMATYLDMTDKYTVGEDILDPGIQVRHPNRNTSKGEDTFKGKENTPKSDKTTNETFTEDRAVVVPEELPGILTKEIFAELADYRADCCISVFLATHRAGVEVNEHFDPIVFKNALQDVTAKLKERGTDKGTIERLLEPGYELIRNDGFWNTLSPGLALFIADGFFKYIKLPVTPLEETIMESSFYVTPLIPAMISKEYFYVLVISKQQNKLFRADAFGMEYIPVALPLGVAEVKRLSEKDASTWRTGGRGGTGGANFHGAGGGNPDEKTNIAVYFEAVDDILFKEIFNKENAPLVLAGVEYLIPIYKSVCDYHNVWPEGLTGNHEYADTATLYAAAKKVMKPYFEQRLNKAVTLFSNQIATALTSSMAEGILPAAYYARVSHLFVCKGEHIWGAFDEASNTLMLHNSPDEGGEDLIDNAVVKTLANGGEVFLLEKDKMPVNSQMAALMRW